MTITLKQAIGIGSAFVDLLPIASNMVQAIEVAMPVGTPGAAKLDAVRVGLTSIYTLAGNTEAQFAQFWPLMSDMIAGFVHAFNTMGIFKKSASVAVAPVGLIAPPQETAKPAGATVGNV